MPVMKFGKWRMERVYESSVEVDVQFPVYGYNFDCIGEWPSCDSRHYISLGEDGSLTEIEIDEWTGPEDRPFDQYKITHRNVGDVQDFLEELGFPHDRGGFGRWEFGPQFQMAFEAASKRDLDTLNLG